MQVRKRTMGLGAWSLPFPWRAGARHGASLHRSSSGFPTGQDGPPLDGGKHVWLMEGVNLPSGKVFGGSVQRNVWLRVAGAPSLPGAWQCPK